MDEATRRRHSGYLEGGSTVLRQTVGDGYVIEGDGWCGCDVAVMWGGSADKAMT